MEGSRAQGLAHPIMFIFNISSAEDGATEHTNQVVEDILRAHVSTHQTDWEKYLWSTKFAFNSVVHSATKLLPFQLVTGLKPWTILMAAVPAYDYVPAYDLAVVSMRCKLNSVKNT